MANILVVKYDSQAQARVWEVAYASQADLCWYPVAYAGQAFGDIAWHFVQHADAATFRIWYARYSSQADLRICRVGRPSLAGWRTDNHPLQGRLG